MAQSQLRTSREASSEQEGPSSPYPRENYFSSINEEYDPEREPKDPSTHQHSSQLLAAGTDKNEWIAKGILRDDATFICPITLHEDPNRCPYDCETYLGEGECDHESFNLHEENVAVELSDLSVHPPSGESSSIPDTNMQRKAPSTDRWRVNLEYGYLVYGGIIQDRPAEEFLEVVDEVIYSIDCHLLDSEIAEARRLARRLKREGDHRDIDIMGRVVSQLIVFRDS